MYNYAIKIWVKSLLLFYVLTISNVAHTQEIEIGTLDGTVSHGGELLSNTRIVVMSQVVASFEAVTNTDDQGYYSFIDVPSGIVDINVFGSNGIKIGTKSGAVVPEGSSLNITLE